MNRYSVKPGKRERKIDGNKKEKHGRFPAFAKIFGKLSGTSNRNNSSDYECDDAPDADDNKNTYLHNRNNSNDYECDDAPDEDDNKNTNLHNRNNSNDYDDAADEDDNKNTDFHNRNNSNDYDDNNNNNNNNDAADEDNNKSTNREKPQKTKSVEQFTDVRNRSMTSVRFKELAEEAQWKEEQERKKAEEAQMEDRWRARSLEWSKSLERVKSLQKEAEQADSKAFEDAVREMHARKGNGADVEGSAGDAPREEGRVEINKKESTPEVKRARSKERMRRQTEEQKGRPTYGEHRQLIREESKGEIKEENKRPTKAASEKASSGHTLVGGGREEKKAETNGASSGHVLKGDGHGDRNHDGNKPSPLKGKSSEKLNSHKPPATEPRYTLHNIELVPATRGPAFADGVVGRSGSWIAGVRAVPRDETAVPMGPRQCEKWRGKDENEEAEKNDKAKNDEAKKQKKAKKAKSGERRQRSLPRQTSRQQSEQQSVKETRSVPVGDKPSAGRRSRSPEGRSLRKANSRQRRNSPGKKRSKRRTLAIPVERRPGSGAKQRLSSNSNSYSVSEDQRVSEESRRSTNIALDLLQNELGEQRRLRRELEQKLEMCEKHRGEEEEEGRRRGEGDSREAEINRRLEGILQAVGGAKSSIVKMDGRMKQLESAVKNQPVSGGAGGACSCRPLPQINVHCLPPGFNLLRFILPCEPIVPSIHPFKASAGKFSGGCHSPTVSIDNYPEESIEDKQWIDEKPDQGERKEAKHWLYHYADSTYAALKRDEEEEEKLDDDVGPNDADEEDEEGYEPVEMQSSGTQTIRRVRSKETKRRPTDRRGAEERKSHKDAAMRRQTYGEHRRMLPEDKRRPTKDAARKVTSGYSLMGEGHKSIHNIEVVPVTRGRSNEEKKRMTKDAARKASSGHALKEDDRKSLHNIEVVPLNRGLSREAIKRSTKDLVGKGSSGDALREDDRKSLHNIEVVSTRGRSYEEKTRQTQDAARKESSGHALKADERENATVELI